jgi:hypothetical protein
MELIFKWLPNSQRVGLKTPVKHTGNFIKDSKIDANINH